MFAWPYRVRGISRSQGGLVELSEPWKPTIPDDNSGFATADKNEALREACERLNVTMTSPPIIGHTQKSIGIAAASTNGVQSWIKISARRDSQADPARAHEIEAGLLVGLPKPEVMAHIDWLSRRVHWQALQMTLAPAPAVELTPWSGQNAHGVTDDWISQFRNAFGELSRVSCDRFYLPPDVLSGLIRARFGDDAPATADEWCVAFCETHWSNVTAPELMLLDWELWGLAPRGYDGALIVCFSAADPALVYRLQSAFAGDLRTPSGRIAQLAACTLVLGWIEMDLVHPALREPVLSLADGVLIEAGTKGTQGVRAQRFSHAIRTLFKGRDTWQARSNPKAPFKSETTVPDGRRQRRHDREKGRF